MPGVRYVVSPPPFPNKPTSTPFRYHLYRRHRIRRYGFHGTSHRYVAFRYRALRNLTREQTNIITLHMGNGCSADAIKGGNSVDTSMGMTPLEGLVMGTRSGDLDPAIVNLIANKEGMSVSEVENLLNTQSGLLGVSGLSNDMRVLQAELKEQDDRRVRVAIEIFCYRARKYIGAFLACMQGADAVVFTGGIGENSPDIRARICAGMEWAGLKIDDARNQQTVGREGLITTDDSKLLAYAIPTDEELLIARDTVRVIEGVPHPSCRRTNHITTEGNHPKLFSVLIFFPANRVIPERCDFAPHACHPVYNDVGVVKADGGIDAQKMRHFALLEN